MKSKLKILFAIVILALFSLTLSAQVTLTGNTAGAELVTALTITNTTPLNFGVVSIPATAGSVILSTSGLRTATGCTLVISGTQQTAAKFDLAGTTLDNYSFTLPSTITVTKVSGSETMIIDNLTVNVDAVGEVPYASIGICTLTGGVSQILVGGKLRFGASQVLGIYAGTYTVSVDYL